MVIAIALETLNQFMERYRILKGEDITQKQALFLCGFNTNRRCETKMQVFRSEKEPSKIKEGLVVHGYLRTVAEGVDESGKILFSNKPHPLGKYYEHCSVLTGKAHLSNLMNAIDYGDYDPNQPQIKSYKKKRLIEDEF
jgi:hypothetical protein